MRIKPVEHKYGKHKSKPITFGILKGKPIKTVYNTNCWNEITKGKYKNYTFEIYQNYEDNAKGPTLIILRKNKLWILSKIKYIYNGKHKTIWNYNNK